MHVEITYDSARLSQGFSGTNGISGVNGTKGTSNTRPGPAYKVRLFLACHNAV
jgi:hypothetical protein